MADKQQATLILLKCVHDVYLELARLALLLE